jgi:pilus assembly protein Flp/PilA
MAALVGSHTFHTVPLLTGGEMTHTGKLIRSFMRREDAATMVEYALMLSLIAVVCIIAVTLIGTNANTIFNNIATNLPA